MSFEILKDPTKIAICGTGDSWQLLPKNTNRIIYCLNDYIHIEKFGIMPDLLFMMDYLDEKPQIVSGQDNLGEVVQRINDLKVPFIGPCEYEEIPLSQSFPIEECVKRFGMPFFTNTICYMIAYALLQGAKEIDFYGVNQAGSHEYAEEKGGVEYWIGVANGLGVKVTIHGPNSQVMLFKGRYGKGLLYGYLASYEEILRDKQRFGETVIRKLVKSLQRVSRTVNRTVNS